MTPTVKIPAWLLRAVACYPRLTADESRLLLHLLERAYAERRPHAEFYLTTNRTGAAIGMHHVTVATALAGLEARRILHRGGDTERFGLDGAHGGAQHRADCVYRLELDYHRWDWPEVAGLRAAVRVEVVRRREDREPAARLCRFLWFACDRLAVRPLPLLDSDDPWWRQWLASMSALLDRGYTYSALRQAITTMEADPGWHATLRILEHPDRTFAEYAPDYVLRNLVDAGALR